MNRKSNKRPQQKTPRATGVSRPAHMGVIGICAALVILVFSVFGQTAGFGFVNFDDPVYVYENPIVSRGITLAGLRWSLFYGEIGHWHPLTWMVHMLDCQLFGLWPGGHHLTSVTLQAIAAVLLFLLLLQMTGRRWCSAFVAAAWAIHPLRAESVAWVSELKDVLSAVFFLLSAGAYVYYARRPSNLRYLAIVVLFTLGLLSKNMLVTLPFVLLVLDYWPLGRLGRPSDFWRLVREKIPLFILSIISCAITFLVPEKVRADESLPAWLRIENAIVSCCIYLRQTVWPVGLAPYYPNPTRPYPVPEVAGALALLCAISALSIRLRKQRPSLLAGWLWFVIMLGPVIGIVQIASYSHADRYTYLPQIGLWIAAAWAAADWAARSRPRRVAMGSMAVVILSALSVAAWRQTAYWRDSQTLWTHALGSTRDNPIARNSLGNALFEQGRTQEAMGEYREALEIDPADALAHNNLGNALRQQGRAEDAIAEYREASRIDPAYAEAHYNLGNALRQQGRAEDAIAEYHEALRIDPAYAEAHNNLGNALRQQGRAEDAIAEYREALRIDPAYADAHFNLGNALRQQGNAEGAIAEYREALQINPRLVDTHVNLGNALLEQGRAEDAIAEYEEAARIDPSLADAHSNLGSALIHEGRDSEGIAQIAQALDLQPDDPAIQSKLAWVLATAPERSLRDGARALQLATRASRSSGGSNPNILRTLAAAYAQEGQFANAVETAQRALGFAPANAPLASALAREIALYKAGRAFEKAR